MTEPLTCCRLDTSGGMRCKKNGTRVSTGPVDTEFEKMYVLFLRSRFGIGGFHWSLLSSGRNFDFSGEHFSHLFHLLHRLGGLLHGCLLGCGLLGGFGVF